MPLTEHRDKMSFEEISSEQAHITPIDQNPNANPHVLIGNDENVSRHLLEFHRGDNKGLGDGYPNIRINNGGHFMSGRSARFYPPSEFLDASKVNEGRIFTLALKADHSNETLPIEVDPTVQGASQEIIRMFKEDGTDIYKVFGDGSNQFPSIDKTYHYAGGYPGADADARLDNAISAATNGDVIYLEAATYASDRTLSSRIKYVGTESSYDANGTVIDTGYTWTAPGGNTEVRGLWIAGSLSVAGGSKVIDCGGTGTITVTGNAVLLSEIRDLDVTFQSGTSGGLVDSSIDVSVTDNGTNTVGDIG